MLGGFLGTLPSLISHVNNFFPLLKQMCLHYALEKDMQISPFLLPSSSSNPAVPYVLHLWTKTRNSPSTIRKKYIKLYHGYPEVFKQKELKVLIQIEEKRGSNNLSPYKEGYTFKSIGREVPKTKNWPFSDRCSKFWNASSLKGVVRSHSMWIFLFCFARCF